MNDEKVFELLMEVKEIEKTASRNYFDKMSERGMKEYQKYAVDQIIALLDKAVSEENDNED